MEIVKKFFPSIMPENELVYFQSFSGILESVDELSALEITKTPQAYLFRLIPSHPKYINLIIEELIKFHNLIGVKLNLGKSIKSSTTITFSISFN